MVGLFGCYVLEGFHWETWVICGIPCMCLRIFHAYVNLYTSFLGVIPFQTCYIELFYLKCIKHGLTKGDEHRKRETGRSSPNAGSLLIQRP